MSGNVMAVAVGGVGRARMGRLAPAVLGPLSLVAVVGCGPETVRSAPLPVPTVSTDTTTEESTEPTEESVEPFPEVAFEEGHWEWDGGVDLLAEVPSGWTRIDREPGWWDLHDPSSNYILRLQVVTGGPPLQVAEAEAVRLQPAEGFVLLGQRELTSAYDGADAQWNLGWELHYLYVRDGEEREATLRYYGTAEATYGALAMLSPPATHAAALAVLDHAEQTLRFAG